MFGFSLFLQLTNAHIYAHATVEMLATRSCPGCRAAVATAAALVSRADVKVPAVQERRSHTILT